MQTALSIHPAVVEALGCLPEHSTLVEAPKAVATNSSIRTLDEPSSRRSGHPEPARIMIAIGDKAANRWHLQLAQRLRRSIQLLHQ
jgi:hypothetical protein